MDEEFWTPYVERPAGLVRPVRTDPTGRTGPSTVAVRGSGWRRVGRGWYVPAEAPSHLVEQRILEESVRLPAIGALTAWAALRWRGVAYFDGLDDLARLPVPVVLGGWSDIGHDRGIAVSRERFWPHEIEVVAGVPCAIAERALFDEVRRDRRPRRAVMAADMTFAASVSDAEAFRAYVGTCQGWTGVIHARAVAALARDDSRSPQETLMRLVWVLDAQLPTPLGNQPVFSRSGRLLGVPDLFDPVAGVVGEYDGADHTTRDRRRRDAEREQRFRDHGLEYFELVAGDLRDRAAVVRRMRSARSRARFLPVDRRAWTLTPPPWWHAVRTA